MSVIFDLRDMENSWANSVNEALETDLPDYIKQNGAVGSEIWWRNYESGAIPKERRNGVVTFVGIRVDNFNEEYNSVEIDLDGKRVDYNRCGYWDSNEIEVGAVLVLELFQIRINQKHGPTTFIFERLVEVIKT